MFMKSSIKRQHEFDIAYMKMAIAMSELSYAIRKKVGSIIVSKNDQVISQGFNGTPSGYPNICEYVNMRTIAIDMLYKQNMPEIDILKYVQKEIDNGNTELKLITKDEVLHAESNAISKCAKYHSSTKDGTLYVTLSPCINCAKLIIQAEIKRVVYLEDYRDDSGIKLLENCGIIVEKLNID